MVKLAHHVTFELFVKADHSLEEAFKLLDNFIPIPMNKMFGILSQILAFGSMDGFQVIHQHLKIGLHGTPIQVVGGRFYSLFIMKTIQCT